VNTVRVEAANAAAATEMGRGGGPNSARSCARNFRLILLFWGTPVALTLLSAPRQAVETATIAAAVLSALAGFVRPVAGLAALPLFAMLSPLAGYIGVAGTNVVLSDILVGLLFVQLVVLVLGSVSARTFALLSPQSLVFICAVMSCCLGVLSGTLITLKPFLYVAQLAVVYLYTRAVATTEASWSVVINAWLAAASFGALLAIHGLFTGAPLASWADGASPALQEGERLNYLFRASHYYANFPIVLGVSCVIACLKVISEKRASVRWYSGLAFLVIVLCLLLMLNKTAIVAVLVSLLVSWSLVFGDQFKRALKNVFYVLVVSGVCVLGVRSYFPILLGDSQFELYVKRASVRSLLDRFEVDLQAAEVWTSNPLLVAFGMGPDFLVNAGDPRIAGEFKISGVTGVAEGTVDSGWLSFLIELGVISFMLIVWLFFRILYALRVAVQAKRRVDTVNSLSMYLFAALLFIVIALFASVLSYGKVAWVVVQLLVIGSLHVRAQHRAPVRLPSGVDAGVE